MKDPVKKEEDKSEKVARSVMTGEECQRPFEERRESSKKCYDGRGR